MSILSTLLALSTGQSLLKAAPTHSTQITAIVGVDNRSTLECWTLVPGPDITPNVCRDLQQLGSTSNGTYFVFAAGSPIDSGTHNAPNVQYFIILEGSATITFPDSSETLFVEANKVYIAADSADVSILGHHTVVAGGSRILQLPFPGNEVPKHNATRGKCEV
ncbi:small secreted protein [Stereum hirsutum FP-91666 SS1]|uniref:Small secreted protein n=1 Tax=Stereum hirsutum (strain FP-91666) TaxID=721885 RepID=R7RVM3_STEHR|nr:small secreted protein [Stereum hirsutum FP-91666 SS1]EIM79124.1 small secreted protein [Stereum hirsutum FP-91666 SS1]